MEMNEELKNEIEAKLYQSWLAKDDSAYMHGGMCGIEWVLRKLGYEVRFNPIADDNPFSITKKGE